MATLTARTLSSEQFLHHQNASDLIVRARDYVAQKQLAQAAQMLEQVVQEQALRYEAWTELGGVYKQLGLRHEALRCYWRAAEIVPDTWPCWHNLLIHRCEEKASAAELDALIRAHTAAASLIPGHVPAAHRAEPFVRLAELLLLHQLAPLAEAPARMAVQSHPAVPAWSALASCLTEQKRWSEALVLWQQVLQQPDVLSSGAHAAAQGQKVALWRAYYALCLFDSGQVLAARAAYEQAIAENPQLHVAMSNLAYLCETLGETKTARDWVERARAVAPDHAAHRFKAACHALQEGQLAQGFADYEARMAMYAPGSVKYNNIFALQQKGIPLCSSRAQLQALRGKRVFIYPEQGYGDFFQYVRFFPQLLSYGFAELSYFTFASLVHYAQSLELPAPLQLVEAVEHSQVDAYIPMMSLPYLLGHQSFADIPAPIGPHWESAPWQPHRQQAATYLRNAMQALALSPRHVVGVSWRGNPEHEFDTWRSIAFTPFLQECIQPLLQAGLGVLCLQQDVTADEVAQLTQAGVMVWRDQQQDWLQTAAMVAQCDAVMAVDTAIIHLAASQMRPTWLLNRHEALSDWRWLRERNDSPWYPSLRIVRQRQPGQWHDVLATAVQRVSAHCRLAS